MRLPALLRLLAALPALCGALPLAAQSVAITDDRGVSVRLAAPATRIVTLAPHLAELAFAAGAGPALVAVSAYSDRPAGARALPVVADAAGVNLERLLALRPDLVLAWGSGTAPAVVRRIELSGIPVAATEPARLEDIARIIRLIGLLAGSNTVAERAARDYSAALQRLRAEHAGHRPLRVFYQLWSSPLMTVSSRHLISDVIALCGGINLFGDLPGLTPSVSREAVLAADPEFILAAGSPQTLAGWEAFPGLTAVRRGQLAVVDADLLQRASPRVLDAAAEVCRLLDEARAKPPTSGQQAGRGP